MSIEKRKGKAYSFLCSKLDFKKGNGLVETESDADDEFQKYILKHVKNKFGTDTSIFFLNPERGPSVPLIYFHRLKSVDRKKIAELHKKAWNMAQAPLLFIILPESVLIYNAYERPKICDGDLDYSATAGLIEEIKLFEHAITEIKKLEKYHRSELLSGNYWQDNNEKFRNEERVYKTLLDNLDFIRRGLIEKDIPPEIVHSLINRSIFVKYLEDRTDKNGNNVFPPQYFNNYLVGATNFVDLLSSKNATYKLFRDLNKKFNGNIFLFRDGEEELVTQDHLNHLKRLLTGKEYLDTGQMMLWPLYSFDVIPIELLSNIYQQALPYHTPNGQELIGVHYTPYHLVTFLMDQVMRWDGKKFDLKILDPSCGSGIFLVEAYRRLISHWMQANPNKKISIGVLNKILKENIYGVDIDSKAIRIAALSLYLTICDYLEPRDIWSNVKFEPIINSNLFEMDFFNEKLPFLNKKFDIIIGNPPWKSQLSEDAVKYLKNHNRPVGDRQISQAFLWRVSDLCKPSGEALLIVSSKGLLFNRSEPNLDFRKQFFSSFNIKTIINFSAMRHIIFSKAVGPGAAILFSPNSIEDSIFYCSPKPTYSPQDDWLLVIDPYDIAKIPKKKVIEDMENGNDFIWKVVMWGSPRDYELIKRISKHPSLKEICKSNGWIDAEGFIIGGEKSTKYHAPELYGKPYVDRRKLKRYTMDERSLPILTEKYFYRSAKTKREIFKGPHLLIGTNPKRDIGIVASLLKNEAIFRDTIIGIHGNKSDINKLSACCLTLNSKIALYYEMLTSRNWLVERDRLQKEEIMNIPIPLDILKQNEINYNVLQNLSKNPTSEEINDKLIMKHYNLTKSELILIDNAIDFTLDYFRRKNRSKAIRPVNNTTLGKYIDTFCRILNNSFETETKTFVGTIYSGNSPLRAVSIELKDKSEKMEKNQFIFDYNLEEVLSSIDDKLTSEESPSLYITRNVRRYSGNSVFIVKLNQMRYWTRAVALRDADETYADIMSLWKGNT